MKQNEKAVDREDYEKPITETVRVKAEDIISTSPVEIGENETEPYIGLTELW